MPITFKYSAGFIVGLFILISSPNTLFAGILPEGSFDQADSSLCQVAGWARDPDASSSIQVDIYRDGQYGQGGVFVTGIPANKLRSDLPFADKNHGFSYVFASSTGMYDGKDHQLFLYGDDVTGDGAKLLNSVPKTIHCAVPVEVKKTSSPEGSFDVANSSLCQIAGWARDPDSTSSVQVDVYRDGPYGSGGIFVKGIPANVVRADLPFSDKSHGFSYTFDTSSGLLDGKDHQLYVYGNDLTGDLSKLLNFSPKNVHCDVKAEITTINIKDFGAKGDGVTDDAPIIKKAIEAISNNGGTINFPAGTYMLGTSAGGLENFEDGTPIQNAILLNKSNVVLKGVGDATVLKLMPHAKMRIIGITGSYTTVDGIVFDGNKSSRNEGTGWPSGDVVDGMVVGGQLANHITIQNCESRNGLEDGIGFWMSNDATVKNCYSHDNGTKAAGSSGISLSGGLRPLAIGNRLENNTGPGLWAAFGGKSVVIKDNIIKGNWGTGITVGGLTTFWGAGDNNGYTITGNKITGNGKSGFEAVMIASALNGTMSNNTITDNVHGSITMTDDTNNPPSSNWTITNNICSNISTAGTQSFGIRILNRSKNVVLTGNICQNNGSSVNDQMMVASTSNVNTNWRTANTLTFGTTTGSSTLVIPDPGSGSVPVTPLVTVGVASSTTPPLIVRSVTETFQQSKLKGVVASTVSVDKLPVITTEQVQKTDLFTRSLSVGSIGSDVKELQKFLNSNGFVITDTGAGSPGNETTKLGGLTKKAIVRFQTANAISPASGYFGPATRKLVNSMLK